MSNPVYIVYDCAFYLTVMYKSNELLSVKTVFRLKLTNADEFIQVQQVERAAF